MTSAHATLLSLEDQGDGWFPLASPGALTATVVATFPSGASLPPFYLVQLTSPLDLQGHVSDTPSGLRLRTLTHLVVRSRWAGVSIGSEPQVSAQLFIVPEGTPLPTTYDACTTLPLHAWVHCSVITANA